MGGFPDHFGGGGVGGAAERVTIYTHLCFFVCISDIYIYIWAILLCHISCSRSLGHGSPGAQWSNPRGVQGLGVEGRELREPGLKLQELLVAGRELPLRTPKTNKKDKDPRGVV